MELNPVIKEYTIKSMNVVNDSDKSINTIKILKNGDIKVRAINDSNHLMWSENNIIDDTPIPDYFLKIFDYKLKEKSDRWIDDEVFSEIIFFIKSMKKIIRDETQKFVNTKTTELTQWQQRLFQRAEHVTQREQKVTQREHDLQQNLQQRTQQVTQRECDLEQRIQEVTQREQQVTQRERNLQQRTQQVTQREQQVTQRERDLQQRTLPTYISSPIGSQIQGDIGVRQNTRTNQWKNNSINNKIRIFTALNNMKECSICMDTKINIIFDCGHEICVDCFKAVDGKCYNRC